MKKSLVVVESPAKAKTIGKYLGRNYKVVASVGHIRDLPVKKIGVDVKKNFKPTYEIIKGKDKVIAAIREAAEECKDIYLAPDPDREGEAIAWHISEELKDLKKKTQRVLFNEITKKAVTEAIEHPRGLDSNKFESQQARRILDRLVGYQISPLLWDKVKRGLSAGRVQSVALRIVVERDKEISAFQSEEYWSVLAELNAEGDKFWAKLAKVKGEKIEIGSKAQCDKIVSELEKSNFKIAKIDRSERRKNPQAPFITSRLQQEASRKLKFTAKKTMMLAQRLYEGIELGEAGMTGLITYMRTDSTRISDDALKEVRKFINDNYGDKYLPKDPIIYKTKKSAQDAHEAIRPTSLDFSPKVIKEFLTPDEFKLYSLIWNRFVACQMVPAVLDQTVVVVEAGPYELRASGSVVKFDGFTIVYEESKDEDSSDEEEGKLPNISEKARLNLLSLKPEQHFTQPPPKYTDASLIRELEEKGIGRPSTYAAILSNLVDKKYVEKDPSGRFASTELGKLIVELLIESFSEIMDVTFTAGMENELDQIEEGEKGWVEVLKHFYTPFKKSLDAAKEKMRNIKAQVTPTEHSCPKCAAQLVIKWGRNGQFIACSNYPTCKTTAEFTKEPDGSIKIQYPEMTDEKCPKCGLPMMIRHGRYGKFMACSGYPDCKTTKGIPLGVKCPRDGGDIIARNSRRGKLFYGCSSYPNCNFVSWDKPLTRGCPKCKSPFLVEKVSKKKGQYVKCPNKECDYEEESQSQPPGSESVASA